MTEEYTAESTEEEYEGGVEQEFAEGDASYESEVPSEEEASGAETTSGSEDQDWGFEPKKKRLSKEVVLGFVAIALLVGIFGVVVAKKFGEEKFAGKTDENQKQDGASDGKKKDDKDEKNDPFDDSDNELLVNKDNNSKGNIQGSLDDSNDADGIFSSQGEPVDDNQFDSQTIGNRNLLTQASEEKTRRDVFGSSERLPNDDQDSQILLTDSSSADQTKGLFESPLVNDSSTNESGDQLLDRDQLDGGGGSLIGAEPLQSNSLGGNTLINRDQLIDGDPQQGGMNDSPFANDNSLVGADSNLGDKSGTLDESPFDAQIGGDSIQSNQLESADTLLQDKSSIEGDRNQGPSGLFAGPLDNGNSGGPGSISDDSQLIDPSELKDNSDDPFKSSTTAIARDNPPNGFGSLSPNQGQIGSNLPNDLDGNSLTDSSLEGNLLDSQAAENAARESSGPFGQEPGLDNSLESPAIAQASGPSGTYQIQQGDSFWTISKKVYGTPKYFQQLADYNKHLVKNPNRLKPKTSILTPDLGTLTGEASLIASQPTQTSDTMLTSSTETIASSDIGSTTVRKTEIPTEGLFFSPQGTPLYRVGKSDTLTTIAEQHLGRWSRWRQIYQMNRDQLDDPNKLKLKMILRLPADASTTPLVSRDREVR